MGGKRLPFLACLLCELASRAEVSCQRRHWSGNRHKFDPGEACFLFRYISPICPSMSPSEFFFAKLTNENCIENRKKEKKATIRKYLRSKRERALSDFLSFDVMFSSPNYEFSSLDIYCRGSRVDHPSDNVASIDGDVAFQGIRK